MAYQQLGLKMLNKSPNPLGSSSFSLLKWPHLGVDLQRCPVSPIGGIIGASGRQRCLAEGLVATALAALHRWENHAQPLHFRATPFSAHRVQKSSCYGLTP